MIVYPSKGVGDPDFRYRPAVATDVRKTFARVRREMAAKQAQQQPQADADVVVTLQHRAAK